ncbi:hypothetical protein KHA80_18095 [Anaerobacillus sp. HL2]|nr:hypothetical protein KHA80_18095 [Anaerobacillus sp. HL2]
MLLDKYGPRKVFSILLVVMAIPTFMFAGNTWMQLFISRLLLSSIGASFVVGIRNGIRMVSTEECRFVKGFYAG